MSRFQEIKAAIGKQVFLGTRIVDGKCERVEAEVGPEHALCIVDGRHLQVVRRDKLKREKKNAE